jgi:hypothetical protein
MSCKRDEGCEVVDLALCRVWLRTGLARCRPWLHVFAVSLWLSMVPRFESLGGEGTTLMEFGLPKGLDAGTG